jgi:hypothetical protein
MPMSRAKQVGRRFWVEELVEVMKVKYFWVGYSFGLDTGSNGL